MLITLDSVEVYQINELSDTELEIEHAFSSETLNPKIYDQIINAELTGDKEGIISVKLKGAKRIQMLDFNLNLIEDEKPVTYQMSDVQMPP